MRLTVGPLPAAVYWRRRAVVLVALAAIVLVVSYSCGGAAPSNAGAQSAGGDTTPTSTPPPHPTVPSPTTLAPTAFSLVTTPPNGPCTDSEIELTASAASATVKLGQVVELTLKVKNVSERTCARDVGADAQELRLQDASGLVWSSDDCNPRHGTNVVSFTPGMEMSFSLKWAGTISRSGVGAANCSTSAPRVNSGVYDLIARLDRKLSAAFQLNVSV